MRTNYVITIARKYGSGGRSIGAALSEKLGIPCYERQILAMASERSGIDENLFVNADERLNGSFIARKLRSMPVSGLMDPSDKEFTSDNTLFFIQSDLIQTLARDTSFIVIGKCADFVLRPYSNVVSVFIDAPDEYCIRTIMDRTSVSQEHATKLYKKTNKYRSEYYKYYTYGNSWTDPLNYDMVLNSSRTGVDGCVDIIYDYVMKKFGD